MAEMLVALIVPIACVGALGFAVAMSAYEDAQKRKAEKERQRINALPENRQRALEYWIAENRVRIAQQERELESLARQSGQDLIP